ncbi:YfhO family protein [Secundilactobacillus oryzae]|nr:YfhO family protein [Secundilactobacillus oryzae]
MLKRNQTSKPSKVLLIVSFFVPALIMLGYFIYRKMAPFGGSSLLTVDLGQQYIDFFAYFRHVFLNDPSSLFYSFSNALGGEMTGTWAYYLMSPVNLILLLFPDQYLTSGILAMTVIKYGLAGLSFAYLLIQTKTQNGYRVPAFATAYALSGWMVANQLNLMWLDAVIILPLVILGIERLAEKNRLTTYIPWLTSILVINYYMAYMVCLFLIGYFLWTACRHFTTWSNFWRFTRNFTIGSITSALLSAFILLPTYFSLLGSKAQYTVTKFKFKFEYFPPKTIAKFFLGSFNFDQMPKGTANIFVGSIVIIGFLYFFINGRIPGRTRIAGAIFTVFLALSLFFQPLDLIWHAMQFPIWYPYRFSFVVIFWLIWLAAITLTPDFVPTRLQLLTVLLVLLLSVSYVWLNLKQFSFLSTNQIIVGIALLGFSYCLIAMPPNTFVLYPVVFCGLVFIELGLNAVLSLNNISYVSQNEYALYRNSLSKQAKHVTQSDSSFYRVATTFMRTKNDPLSNQYFGGSIFSSTLKTSTPKFFGKIGQPDGDGFVAYTNGTLVSDALLSTKYVFTGRKTSLPGAKSNYSLPTITEKPDTNQYSQIQQTASTQSYQNPYSLPVGFLASSKVLTTKNTTLDPVHYQANWLASLTGNTADRQLFTAQDFNHVLFDNVGEQTNLTGSILKKQDLLKPASITLTFKPTNNNSYYLTLGQNIDEDNVTLSINGNTMHQYPTFRNTVITNVASHAKGKTIRIKMQLKHNSLWLQNFTLYELNNAKFKQAVNLLKQAPLTVTHYNQRTISGTINVKANSRKVLTTSIPFDKGWHATVDGKAVEVYKSANYFAAIKLSKGRHQVKLSYWPPYLTLGLIISLVTLALTIVFSWFHRRQS